MEASVGAYVEPFCGPEAPEGSVFPDLGLVNSVLGGLPEPLKGISKNIYQIPEYIHYLFVIKLMIISNSKG